MKKIILIVLIALTACGTQINSREEIPDLNKIKEVSTGEIFYSLSIVKGEKDSWTDRILGDASIKKELSVASVTKKSLSLHYKEYVKPLKSRDYFYGGKLFFLESDGWKQEMTEKYDYDIARSKIVSVKGLKFEIIEITDSGAIKYKRIK